MKKILIILTLMSIIILSGCENSFDACMDKCIQIKEGYGESCGFGFCLTNYQKIDETIENVCYDECK